MAENPSAVFGECTDAYIRSENFNPIFGERKGASDCLDLGSNYLDSELEDVSDGPSDAAQRDYVLRVDPGMASVDPGALEPQGPSSLVSVALNRSIDPGADYTNWDFDGPSPSPSPSPSPKRTPEPDVEESVEENEEENKEENEEESKEEGKEESEEGSREGAWLMVGLRVLHSTRGAGTVTSIGAGDTRLIHFDSGEGHRYGPKSFRKLKPLEEKDSKEDVETWKEAARLYADECDKREEEMREWLSDVMRAKLQVVADRFDDLLHSEACGSFPLEFPDTELMAWPPVTPEGVTAWWEILETVAVQVPGDDVNKVDIAKVRDVTRAQEVISNAEEQP